MSDAGVNTSSEITTKDLKEGSYGGGGEWIEAPMEADNEMKMRRLRQLQANGQLKMMRMTMLKARSRRLVRMTRQQKWKSSA
uniref:Uncharacterized protein n=2 Tax=Sus scrofa TaxID=9823 RepID=A0A8D1BUP1_PIG